MNYLFPSHDPLKFLDMSIGAVAMSLNGGKLGIGDTTPNAPLTIVFTDNSTNATDNSSLTHSSGIYLNNESTTNESYTGVGFRSHNVDGALALVYEGSDNTGRFSFNMEGSEKFVIKSTGKVGIGHSNPDVKLQVMGNTTISGSESGNLDFIVRNTHGTALSRVIVQNNGTDQNMIMFADDANDYGSIGSSTGGSNNIRFKTGTDAYFEGGNFGFNTANPETSLHVSASSSEATQDIAIFDNTRRS